MQIRKETSLILKAVAILFVLAGHLTPPFLPFSELYIPIKRFISQVGVNLFLFISGYGIAVTYLFRTLSAGEFLARRFFKLWPLYTACLVFAFVFQTLLFHEPVAGESLAIHFTGLQVYFGVENEIYPIFHFISAITVLYLFTSLSLVFRPSSRTAVLGLLLLVHAASSFLLRGEPIFIDYFCSFSLGILYAELAESQMLSQESFVLFFPIPFLAFAPARLFVVVATMLLIPLLVRAVTETTGRLPKLKAALIRVGTNSYFIYLAHNYFFWKWPQLLARLGTKTRVGVVIVLATTAWSLLLFTLNRYWDNSTLARAVAKTSYPGGLVGEGSVDR